MTDIDQMLNQYIVTALWSSSDESDDSGGDSMDKNYSPEDIADDSRKVMRADCEKFANENRNQIEEWGGEGDAWEQAGHDFWMTRNGHGVGFWDRNAGEWPNDGKELTEASRVFGKCNLYVGDDGGIHYSNG